MENASKALIMAGGILIAIIIIALLVRTFSTINQFQMSNLSEEEQKKLIAFNEQYTKYLNQYVYGSDVKTLLKRWDATKEVEVIIYGDVPGADYSQEYTYVPGEFDTGTSAHYTTDTKYYKCTNIEFDDNTGKVKSITFEHIEVSAEADT